MLLTEAGELLDKEKELHENLKAIIYDELARLPFWVLSDLDKNGFASIVSIFRYNGLTDPQEAKQVYQNMIASQANEKLKHQSGLSKSFREPRKLAVINDTPHKLQLIKRNLVTLLSSLMESESASLFVANATTFIQWLDAA